MQKMNIAVIGLGLMGGSFALDIKSVYSNSKIFGIDNSDSNLKEALALDLIDQIITYDDLIKMDIVLVSIPVNYSLIVIPKVLEKINENTLVFDVGSTKEAICQILENHPKRANFLAAHPMAGTEFSGPKAAHKGLYIGKTNILCEFEKTDNKLREFALEIFDNLNMKIIYMDPKPHDVHVAYVSHLSHISSFMLGKTVIEKEKNEKNIFDLAGSGFESTVRLAKSLPETWTPIFLQNKNNLDLAIDEYISNLNALKKIIENNDSNKLSSILNNTNRIKEILSNKLENGK
jgi:prephenate dehydrogenase